MKNSLQSLLGGIILPAICLFIFLLSTQLSAQATGDYRSVQSGNWNSTSTWERWDGSQWVTPSPSTPTTPSNVVTIRNTHTVTVTASVTVDQIVIDVGGQVNINSGVTWTINDLYLLKTLIRNKEVRLTLVDSKIYQSFYRFKKPYVKPTSDLHGISIVFSKYKMN